jgi:hypothetical protein
LAIKDGELYQYYKNKDASEAAASNKSAQQGSDSFNGQFAANLEPKSNIKITSKTFGQPIETTIAGKKVKLRVDAEPDGNKIQIQAGSGKNSTVDVRIDPTSHWLLKSRKI